MTDEIDYDKLVEDTRSTRFPGKPFGYEFNLEMAEIAEALEAEGWDRSDPRFFFEQHRRRDAIHRGSLSFRQRQDLAKWLGLAWAGGGKAPPSTDFTEEELEYIGSRLFGANDPVGQSILSKIASKVQSPKKFGDEESG